MSEIYLDPVQYWRQVFTESQDEVNRLRTEIERLKSTRSRLPASQLQGTGVHELLSSCTAPATTHSSRKKRKTESQMKRTSAEQKRRRTRLSTSTSDDGVELSEDASQVFNTDSRDLDAFLHYLHALQHSIRTPQLESDAIALNVILLTYSMRHVIGLTPSRLLETEKLLRPERHRLVFSKDRAVFRCFPQILQALEAMSPDQGLWNTALYTVQQVLHAVVKAICGGALAGSREEAAVLEDHPDELRLTDGNKSIRPNKDRFPGYARSGDLCDGFLSMLRCLDHSKSWHKDILEGALYLLITTIGRRLHWAMWQQEACPEEAFDTFRLEGESMEQKQAAFEAQVPFLIPLLEQSLRLAARCQTYRTSEADTSELATGPRNMPCGISGTACLKLQRTLIQAAFAIDDTDALHSSLSPPDVPDSVRVNFEILAPCRHLTAAERFKNELWRLLGWDVLDSMHQDELCDPLKA